MLRPYRDILTTPGALHFSLSGLVARLPISMVGIGIVLLVFSVSGSYGLAGRVSAVYVVANAVVGPRLARLVDRYGQARVMRPSVAIACAGLAALIVVAMLDAPTPWLYVTAAVAGAPAGSFGSLVRARWSYVLDDPRQVHTAYSLESALDEVVFVVGPVLATMLATSVAPAAGLVVPIAAMLLGGFVFLALRGTEPPPRPVVRDAQGGRERGRAVMRSRGMVVLALVFVGMGVVFGAVDVSTVAFAEERGSAAWAGLVLACFALGSLISGLGYGARHWASPLWLRFVLGFVALGIGASLVLVVTTIPMLALVMFATGFAIAPTLISGNGLVQHLVRPEQLTEGLTWVVTALGIGVSVGSSVAGVLIDRQGPHGGFLVVALAATTSVVITLGSIGILRADTTPAAATPVAPGPPVADPTVAGPAVERAAPLRVMVEGEPSSATCGAAVTGAALSDAGSEHRADDAVRP